MGRRPKNKEQNKNNETSKAKKSTKAAARNCLSCRKSFPSEGAHHRICDGCKTLQGWTTGNPSFWAHRPNAANDNG